MVTPELAEFLSGQLDIQMGTRDAELRPHSVRVTAMRVEDDQHVVAFVPDIGAAEVLRDLTANGQVAIFAGRPPDNRAYQLKGVFADAQAAQPSDRTFIEHYWDTYLESLAMIGIARLTFSHWPVWPSTAVRVRVTSVFSQTPGPGAGASVA
jgi:hypothetical protein